MTAATPQQNQEVETPKKEATPQEINFRKQAAMYERMLEQERQARQDLEEKLKKSASVAQDDDEGDDDEYVGKRTLHKTLNKFAQSFEQKVDEVAERKARALLEEEKKYSYLKENSDFNEVMSPDMLERFATQHPRLAENILRIPDGFERQKLVYENIKALGLDRPQAKEPSVHEKIEANRRSPYYQPSGMGTAPYGNTGDFSPSGQKNAYEKLKELKSRLRI